VITDLLKVGTLEEFCREYKKSEAEVMQAFELFKSARERMTRHVQHFQMWRREIFSSQDFDVKKTDSLTTMRRAVWEELIKRCGVLETMTQKRRDQLQHDMADPANVPDITPESITAFMRGAVGELPQLIEEAIEEAMHHMCPRSGAYVTNGDGFMLGEKAVVDGICVWVGHLNGLTLNTYYEGVAASIENAFSLVDGKGPARYPSSLLTAIRQACKSGVWEFETAYFYVKLFKKGTMHLKFKRMDLVAELNKRNADHRTLRKGKADAV
jgi:hypothetical protein